jgi:uncharacterized protein YuzE
MKIQYDKSADAAYIYLDPAHEQIRVARTVPCDPSETNAEINLDFDEDGRLLGIEVLDASRHLPKDLLDTADRI